MGNIITQQCAIYQFKLEETKVNIYGEAAEEKYYDGPFLFNVLINRSNEAYAESDEGIQFNQPIEFYFFRDDLVDAKVVPEVGDIILYQEGYYGVQSTVANQYFGGKNPSYPNNDSNEFNQPIEFYFFRDDLVDAKVVPEVGDIILYQEGYYGVQSTVANQYFGGKNPSYPNNDSNGEPNPLNPDLDQFGNNLSILVSTYYIPSDKVAISPYIERF